jgi:ubiquinol-cytochrome c reductase cytochrome b subunit
MTDGKMKLFSLITELNWGEKSLVSLYCSIGSGVILSLQYEPSTPFYSINAIQTLIPYGSFWRSFHFYSSQLFFLLLLLHLLAVIPDKFRKLSPGRWVMLAASLPVVILLLFTGYVLRADATGESAGIIAENLVLTVPVFDNWLNSLLFSIQGDGMKRVYANHLINLGVLWTILCWDHVRRYRVKLQGHGLLLCGLIAFCLLVPAPMEPYRFGLLHISGPWFFLGVQEMLRSIDPFVAGVVFPLTPLLALFLLNRKEEGRWRKPALIYLISWLALYGALSLVSVMRG